MRYITSYHSPLGEIILGSEGQTLGGLWFQGQRYIPELGGARREELPIFRETRGWLEDYFAGRDPGPTPPLSPVGTGFQREVWKILQNIPYGHTSTYGEVAREVAVRLGSPSMSPQAVGGAVGHNPISILIPCHRVVGKNGSLTGYAGGLHRKEALLELEGALRGVTGSTPYTAPSD